MDTSSPKPIDPSTDLDYLPIDPLSFRREQVEMLFGQLTFILSADVVAGTFLFLTIGSLASSPWPYLWFALLISSTLLRAILAKQHKQHLTEDADTNKRWRFLIQGSFTSGVIWGTAWLLLPADPSFLQMAFVALWLAGLSAGAASTMGVIKEVFIAFTVPASLLFVGFVVLQDDDNRFILGGAFLMYLGFILPIAIRTGRDFNRTIRLQLNNQSLRASLNSEAERLHQKEIELLAQRKRSQILQSEKEYADEKLLAAAEERLLLLDAVGEGIFGINNRGDVTFINRSALTLLKLSESSVLHESALKLISASADNSAANVEAYVAITSCFSHGIPVQNMDSVFAGKSGLNLPVRFSCKPVYKDGSVIGAVVSFSDISKQKEMEAMLFQSQKMEAIGRLTGGVSHDFNNLLTVIMGNLKFLMKHLTGDEKAATLVNKIMNAAKNGAELNNRLLSFSREQTLESDIVDVAEVILEMEEFLDRLLGEDIHLDIKLTEQKCIVMIDRTQLENAILNLGVNARDAMPKGGTLTISTNKVQLSNAHVLGDESAGEADYIDINITDNGIGISELIQKQIFDPFFTTKEKHHGTGLGLSTVYGFIRQSGGNITVQSQIGEWTSFNLYLPVANENIAAQKIAEEPELIDEKFQGTILVVEDDYNVRDVAARMLEEAGYQVITAENGYSGLEKFNKHPEINLVFSDMIMPGGMTGLDMAEEMLWIKPRTPILLATGYTEKVLKERMLEIDNIVCVSKPYDTDALPRLMNSMMVEYSQVCDE